MLAVERQVAVDSERAVQVAEVLIAQRRIQIVDAELQVVIAALAGHEPREHVVCAVRDVEPAVGAGALLILEVEVVQLRQQDLLIVTVRVEVRIAEEHVLADTADTRNVLTFVEPMTELRLPTTVQSTSVSASCRGGV